MIRNKCQYRYDIQADHGFRKRFNTILKLNNSINYNITEKLMCHKNGLMVHLVSTIDELFVEFKKAISDIDLRIYQNLTRICPVNNFCIKPFFNLMIFSLYC